MSQQRWYDELGRSIWKESFDNLADERVDETPQPTQDAELVPAAFERAADPEDVPEAEKLPPAHKQAVYVEGWGWQQPISAVDGLRVVVRLAQRRLRERDNGR
jgi:hypothetical protein